MKRRAFATSLASASLASAQLRTVRAAEALPIVNAGITPSDVAAVVAYAKELGHYQSVGLDVRLSVMSSGPVIATAVVGGTLDVGAINTGSLASAHVRGLPLQFLAPASIEIAGLRSDLIMVRPDSAVRTAADMNGKTVALGAVKTMQHAAFLQWVEKSGGDWKSLKFIEIPFPEMIGALDQGRVDVAIPSEPFSTMALPKHRVVASIWDAMQPPFMIFGIGATEHWLDEHPDLAAKFSAATRRAAAWANTHPHESADILVRLTKVDPSIAKRMARAVYGTTLDAGLIQPVIDVVAKYGFIDKSFDASAIIWPQGSQHAH